MRHYTTQRLRNVAFCSHGGAGKTSLAEAMMYDAGVIDRLGRTDDGTATLDYEPEEVRRKISINLAVGFCPWREHKLNLLDAPGYFDFAGEVKSALRVADSALVVVDAVGGVEVGTELVWRYADEVELPRIVCVNKMDRENADFERVLGELRDAFGKRVVAVQLPIGQEAGFRGVVDLIGNRAIGVDQGGKAVREGEVPGELQAAAGRLREALVEAAAEMDDELTLKYLDGAALTPDEIRAGLGKGVRAGKIVPVLCCSAQKNIGVQPVLDAIVDYLPSPDERGEAAAEAVRGGQVRLPVNAGGPLAAIVFKTMADPYVGKLTLFKVQSGTFRPDSQVFNANRGRVERVGQVFQLKGKTQEPIGGALPGDIAAVAKLQDTATGDTLCAEANPLLLPGIFFSKPVYAMAIVPKAKGDEDKIAHALHRMVEEDPTLTVERSGETHQILIRGMGDLHLDVVCERLKRKFGVEVALELPKVPYRETIRGSAKKQGRHKKQTGGRGQFGDVWLELQPLPDAEFEFVDKIFGGAVPVQYRPAVEKGVREVMVEGVVAGYPVTHVRVTLHDGSYHPVDSSEMAFKIAAHLAFRAAFMEAKPVLLEPITAVEITVPDAYMGDVIGDLNKRRGKILGMEPAGRSEIVRALVPMAEMFRYAPDLRSITGGRGTYTIAFDHYEDAPPHVSQQVIEAARAKASSA